MTGDFYFQRFGFCERQILAPVPRELGLVVTIPCHNEPDLIGSLASLWQCERPSCACEVIVVINSAQNSNHEIRAQNQTTFVEAADWARSHCDSRLSFHLLQFPDLPPRQAGVGLARKIAMDEAARRFDDAGNSGGIIACFDADCRCAGNYLTGLEQHFRRNPRTPGCSIYFEHLLDEGEGSAVQQAITSYELHLRYYVQALRWAGFPQAHHMIGSCMAVRADAYIKQGGMNRRQAGEDFYFLQKISALGDFTDLTDTVVFPSARPSDRVPFGTGRAVSDFLKERQRWTYPWLAFEDLRKLLEFLPQIYRLEDATPSQLADKFPESVRTFLEEQAFDEALDEIRQNTSTEAAFRKRFFHWFNGFRAMKFVHHARESFYGKREVAGEARELLRRKGICGGTSLEELLRTYRKLDRLPLSHESLEGAEPMRWKILFGVQNEAKLSA